MLANGSLHLVADLEDSHRLTRCSAPRCGRGNGRYAYMQGRPDKRSYLAPSPSTPRAVFPRCRALIAEVRREQTASVAPADPPSVNGLPEPVAGMRPLPVVHHAHLDEHPSHRLGGCRGERGATARRRAVPGRRSGRARAGGGRTGPGRVAGIKEQVRQRGGGRAGGRRAAATCGEDNAHRARCSRRAGPCGRWPFVVEPPAARSVRMFALGEFLGHDSDRLLGRPCRSGGFGSQIVADPRVAGVGARRRAIASNQFVSVLRVTAGPVCSGDRLNRNGCRW